ncbi:MAG: ATP-binding protein [Candidatus Binatia bacterium]
MILERALRLPRRPDGSFFLWGPRQTGKSTLLRSVYPRARRIDLLSSREFARFAGDPGLLREEIEAARHGFVIIDEVQKVPALLDEVHWLIENRGIVFALCGSSARKVRRGHANLLGGRAIRRELFGLVSSELGTAFDVTRAVNHGYLPRHYLSDTPRELIRAYVDDYLKEEIAAEGLTRNLPAFSDFLSAAALADGQLVSFSTIARDSGVSAYTAKAYFQILVDTLLGRFLPAYRRRPKRRVIQSPKFYFADVGVVNHLAKRGPLEAGGELFGTAFENWMFHELSAYRAYRGFRFELSYWRLASGIEVDFLVDDARIAFEAKATAKAHADHLRGLRELRVDHPKSTARFAVTLDPRPRKTDDGIEILPARIFAERLWADDLIR